MNPVTAGVIFSAFIACLLYSGSFNANKKILDELRQSSDELLSSWPTPKLERAGRVVGDHLRSAVGTEAQYGLQYQLERIEDIRALRDEQARQAALRKELDLQGEG